MKKSTSTLKIDQTKILTVIFIATVFTCGFLLGKSTINKDEVKKEIEANNTSNQLEFWGITPFTKDFSTDNWKIYTSDNLVVKYPIQYHICKFENLITLVSATNVNSACKKNTLFPPKNLIGTKLYKPTLVRIDGLPVFVYSGIAMGTSERFIFANFEYENKRVILQMEASVEEEFPIFYQILSTAKFK